MLPAALDDVRKPSPCESPWLKVVILLEKRKTKSPFSRHVLSVSNLADVCE
jgi:hypothetical protein